MPVILPAALLWGFCRWEYRVFVSPNEMARKELKAKKGLGISYNFNNSWEQAAHFPDYQYEFGQGVAVYL